jgi:hypothetical protein
MDWVDEQPSWISSYPVLSPRILLMAILLELAILKVDIACYPVWKASGQEEQIPLTFGEILVWKYLDLIEVEDH